MKYSILTLIINNYEIVREIQQKDPQCQYLLITDNPNIKSSTWNVIYDQSLNNLKGTFNKVYNIKYNPFKYCTTNICILVDGSMKIKKSLRPLYEKFISQNYDIALMPHPGRNNFIKEIDAWVNKGRYFIEKANNLKKFLKDSNYDINYKGLFQCGFRITKNTKINSDINQMTLSLLKYLGDENDVERIDQLIYSFIMNRYFNYLKVLPLSEQIIKSNYIGLCVHNSLKEATPINIENSINKIMFDKIVKCYILL